VDEYGFERPGLKVNYLCCYFFNFTIFCFILDDFDYKAYEAFASRYLAILTRRAMRWNSILSQQNLPDGGTMKRFVRKGVPAQFRGKV
jgi:hypothetical protein